MHRLFFALTPDDALRRDIAAIVQENGLHVGGRAIRPDRYHMTLQFIGDFPALTAGLRESLLSVGEALATSMPFDIVLDQIGSFNAGRVAWLGCSAPHEPLARLHADLAAALSDAGVVLKPEGGFVPHVTVRRNGPAPVARTIAPRRWRVDHFELIDATAGEYRQLGRWPGRCPGSGANVEVR